MTQTGKRGSDTNSTCLTCISFKHEHDLSQVNVFINELNFQYIFLFCNSD